ncbi:putative serine/threonine-protein kinase-like protein CCR3 [Lolium rigidum]|uniref:putative serine/threonine-protein kinase-like protein CCR3 n=1 Tax=Lolium rigidum TaxID=89674 RepID=UPI001F5D1AC0|nr:putative serine/threonine-protein kinase-like protein CCR3 [Lolium rigidum]
MAASAIITGLVAAGGLISKIIQAADTAQHNKRECKNLASRVQMIAELLPQVQDPEAMRPLAGLGEALTEAHELVQSCQRKGRTYRFFAAGRQSDRFREVQGRIDSLLILFPMIGLIGLARRLDGTGHVSESDSEGAEVFTLAEITAATKNFGVVLGKGDSGTVYKGKLHDGREVAVKRFRHGQRSAEATFGTELAILHPVSHEHIVRLLGSCAEDEERMLVYENVDNGTLRDQLNNNASPLTTSWKARVGVLLGAARAIYHLHCRAIPLLIHCNVTSSNILLDRSWTPRLAGFGASVWRAPDVESQAVDIAQTYGYEDPEYCRTGGLKPATDLYSLGVVMLEVLTGNQPVVAVWEETKKTMVDTKLVSWALPTIEAGQLGDVLDRRPTTEPTPQQCQALQLVASTASICLRLQGDNRPAIPDVVANLEKALQLICNDMFGRLGK